MYGFITIWMDGQPASLEVEVYYMEVSVVRKGVTQRAAQGRSRRQQPMGSLDCAISQQIATVLVMPPEAQSSLRRNSAYWQLECPTLRGDMGIQRATDVVAVHFTGGLEDSKPQQKDNIAVAGTQSDSSRISGESARGIAERS